MLNNLTVILSIVCMVCSGLFFVINYLCQQPMRIKVDNMSDSQKEISATLKVMREENKKEEILISNLEGSCASAHKRLTEYESRLREVEQRCNTCAVCNRRE